MNKLFTFAIIVFLQSISNIYASNPTIISSINVETDYEFEGAKGIYITYKYSFLSVVEESHNDTILKDCTFKILTKLQVGNTIITPLAEFKTIKNNDGELETINVLSSNDITPTKYSKTISKFIPYAALNLVQGEHTINVLTELTGKDATEKDINQKLEKKDITFTKPLTKKFFLDIDYIEVNTLTSGGNAWDYAIFKTDAPDVGVDVKLGGVSLFATNVNDTYMFSVGPKSRNIQFDISENDNITILVQDIDVFFHDFIAKWNLSTKNKKAGVLYNHSKAGKNIKACNLDFKFE